MAGKIKVPSELVPSQSNQVMLRSKYIYDDVKGHTQEEVNAALEEQIESKVIEAGGVNWDTIPTAGSDNAVKSKDIKAALEKVTGYFVLDSNVTEATVAKTVTVADFPNLTLGGSIKIKMLTKNTAANPTLRIGPSNAPAYPLYYDNKIASASNSWKANEVISVYFDGSNYQASNAQVQPDLIKLAEGLHKFIGLTASITIPVVLPADYTVLDYIANISASGGYIDTGINPNDNNWKFEGSWMLTGAIETYQAIIAAYSAETANTYRIVYNNTSTTSVLLGANTKASAPTTSPVNDINEWNTFSIQYGTATINGTVVPLGTTAGTVITNNMCLFSNTAATKFLVGKMRRFKASHNGILVRDMIPCINPQNVYGMYDIVNNVFYGSSNENNFTGGN